LTPHAIGRKEARELSRKTVKKKEKILSNEGKLCGKIVLRIFFVFSVFSRCKIKLKKQKSVEDFKDYQIKRIKKTFFVSSPDKKKLLTSEKLKKIEKNIKKK
jgi:hypothetical protein